MVFDPARLAEKTRPRPKEPGAGPEGEGSKKMRFSLVLPGLGGLSGSWLFGRHRPYAEEASWRRDMTHPDAAGAGSRLLGHGGLGWSGPAGAARRGCCVSFMRQRLLGLEESHFSLGSPMSLQYL